MTPHSVFAGGDPHFIKHLCHLEGSKQAAPSARTPANHLTQCITMTLCKTLSEMTFFGLGVLILLYRVHDVSTVTYMSYLSHFVCLDSLAYIMSRAAGTSKPETPELESHARLDNID
jgi:hypothetical protein